ncbi:Methyl-accepting chemotaxis protein signailing domain-containing protein [Desulfonema limicola]|uniref:Methyl-accepting chemotaxis protein signailing domain-containing protein n=1 Tax=Desulfonema limicola TaxID=45656 RepID=A0A975B5D9_9BACT|nr:methyl-accepting chemotaxis protein [Desulfonema limicola]QTA79097.1 Methyl-accepting chemotaxis protein signailing domain-containing protein [Desulfonema limicola]
MIKDHTLFKKIMLYLTDSVKKKITTIIILPFILSLILVLTGTYVLYLENVILIVVRMEREWLDVNLNGFKYLNRYIITDDKEVLKLSLNNLERGYNINKIGPQIKAFSEGKRIDKKGLAKQMDELLYSCNYEELSGVVNVVGLLGSHEYVKVLMEEWNGAFEDFEKNMPIIYKYIQTGDKALLAPIFKFSEDFKTRGDIFSEYSAKLSSFAYSLTTKILWFLFLSIGFITLTISFKYIHSLINAFNSITGMLKIIAEGDMSQRLNLNQRDEIGIMSQAVNNICEKMGKNISLVIVSSNQLSADSLKQASSVEEISASLEEMSSMTRKNADNAGQVNELMKHAGIVVTKANDSINGMTISMEKISKAGEETSKIIKTIDEIAFQTNLLALNAAVEAARAGETGAGFAVVADEVRSLALRTAEASKNTTILIKGIGEKIKNGSEILRSVNETFIEISEITSKAGKFTDEIAAASGEQADGITQIAEGIAEVDKITQQNASGAEDLAASANMFKIA